MDMIERNKSIYKPKDLTTFNHIHVGSLYIHQNGFSETHINEDQVRIKLPDNKGGRSLVLNTVVPAETHDEGLKYFTVDIEHQYRDPDATIFVLAWIPTEGRWIDIANCKDGQLDKIKTHIEDYKKAYPNIKLVMTYITHTIDMQVNFNSVVSDKKGTALDIE